MGPETTETDADDRTQDLPSATTVIDVLKLLIAADTFPRGAEIAYC
jgi:hypothetical protein